MGGRLDDFDTRFGARLRALRLQRGLSLPDIAEEIGISYQQLQKYEAGRNSLSARRLFQIADILEVEPQTLLELTCANTPHEGANEVTACYLAGERSRLRKAYSSLPEPMRLAFLHLIEGAASQRSGQA